jgi:DNA-binding protein HU-beta
MKFQGLPALSQIETGLFNGSRKIHIFCQANKQFLRHFKAFKVWPTYPIRLTGCDCFFNVCLDLKQRDLMNKAQLIEKLAEKMDLSKTQSEAFLDATLEIIQKAVAKGEEVKLVGFGTFSRLNRKSRNGRNPKTGAPVTIPDAKVPRFKPGKDFKDLLN